VCTSVSELALEGERLKVISARVLATQCTLVATLRRSEELFRDLLRDLQVGVLLQGPNAEILLSNPAALNLLGVTEDQLLGRSSFDPSWNVIREDGSDFPGPEHPVPQAIASKKPVHNVVMGVFRPEQRDRVWLLVNADPRLEDGEIKEVICTFSDITQHKALERELRKSQRLESIGGLASGVAHDFNNLLTVIMTCVSELPASGDDDFDPKQEILAAAERGAALTSQLLSFASMRVLAPEIFSVDETIHQAASLLRRLIGTNIDLLTDLHSAPWLVRSDSGQFSQILLNLCANARDAMPRGGKLEIRTERTEVGAAEAEELGIKPGDYIALEIEDTGSGMPPEVLERVLEPFFTTKQAGRGTGLGLSTVHRIVLEASGALSIRSEPGKGSTFRLLWPRFAGESESTRNRAAPAARPRKILVVEDEPVVRWNTERILTRAGHEVHSVSNASEARDLLDQDFEVLITDIVMPGESGLDLARDSLRTKPDLRVLIVSGYSSELLGGLELEPRKLEFLDKPFTGPQLVERLNRLVAE
jgi:PAS domain S-box-containing protein